MKDLVRNLLQKLLTFRNYLFLFSLYSIRSVENGKYEREFMYFLKIVKGKGVILDLGANIGITGVPLAKRFEDAEVHAFEPILENFATLERVVSYFKLSNLKLFNLALGNREGTLKMIMPIQGNSRMQGLCKALEEGSDEKGIIYEVPVRRLDDLYPDLSTLSAIKIDVENFEYEVLKGGEQLLMRNKPIIYCELWDNENRRNVFGLLQSIGYRIYTYNSKTDSLAEMQAEGKVAGNNFFFVHTDDSIPSVG